MKSVFKISTFRRKVGSKELWVLQSEHPSRGPAEVQRPPKQPGCCPPTQGWSRSCQQSDLNNQNNQHADLGRNRESKVTTCPRKRESRVTTCPRARRGARLASVCAIESSTTSTRTTSVSFLIWGGVRGKGLMPVLGLTVAGSIVGRVGYGRLG